MAALRKLDATEHNLVRLADLTAEVKRQLGSLQRQARKAERYHELRRQFEELELRIHIHHHGTLRERVARQEEQLRGLAELQETLRTEAATLEAAHEAAGLEALGAGALPRRAARGLLRPPRRGRVDRPAARREPGASRGPPAGDRPVRGRDRAPCRAH